jgi:hypothetical protein
VRVFYPYITFLLFILVTVVASHAKAEPRLFSVSKAGLHAFVLAESHLSTAIEHNKYLNNVVIPAARASTIYAQEGPPGLLRDVSNFTDCTGLDARARRDESNRLLNKTLFLNPGYLAIGSTAKLKDESQLRDFIDTYPFFMKLIELKDQISKRINTTKISKLVNSAPASQVFQTIVVKQKGKHTFVETTADFKNAFCAVPFEKQHDVVQALVGQLAKTNTAELDLDAVEKCYLSTLSNTRTQVTCANSAQKDCLSKLLLYPSAACKNMGIDWDDGFYPFALTARTQTWIPNVERLIAEGYVFFSLGSAHLPDTTQGPGLFSILRERGYKVVTIENAKQLREALQGRKRYQ